MGGAAAGLNIANKGPNHGQFEQAYDDKMMENGVKKHNLALNCGDED